MVLNYTSTCLDKSRCGLVEKHNTLQFPFQQNTKYGRVRVMSHTCWLTCAGPRGHAQTSVTPSTNKQTLFFSHAEVLHRLRVAIPHIDVLLLLTCCVFLLLLKLFWHSMQSFFFTLCMTWLLLSAGKCMTRRWNHLEKNNVLRKKNNMKIHHAHSRRICSYLCVSREKRE